MTNPKTNLILSSSNGHTPTVVSDDAMRDEDVSSVLDNNNTATSTTTTTTTTSTSRSIFSSTTVSRLISKPTPINNIQKKSYIDDEEDEEETRSTPPLSPVSVYPQSMKDCNLDPDPDPVTDAVIGGTPQTPPGIRSFNFDSYRFGSRTASPSNNSSSQSQSQSQSQNRNSGTLKGRTHQLQVNLLTGLPIKDDENRKRPLSKSFDETPSQRRGKKKKVESDCLMSDEAFASLSDTLPLKNEDYLDEDSTEELSLNNSSDKLEKKLILELYNSDFYDGSAILIDGALVVNDSNPVIKKFISRDEPIKIFGDAKINFNLKSVAHRFKDVAERLEAKKRKKTSDLNDVASFSDTSDVSLSKTEAEFMRRFSKDYFSELEIIGQFNKGFIIAKKGNDLFIIDQHASDEKNTFEHLKSVTEFKSQQLLIPITLDLSLAEEMVVMDNISIFNRNGFQIEFDESKPVRQRARLTSCPYSKNMRLGTEDVNELISNLSETPGVMHYASKLMSTLASRACRTSVMIGKSLSRSEMQKIVNNMALMDNPWSCPHGRPTMRHLYEIGSNGL
eukprot:TRINITY_DN1030_c0_g1_i2.p1 TRINITY_DN1030_c0_g1~~TRINITY_DN1030_c0_g1_i2.p1  ORF type:complete len:561 (-),score=102.57 TRINITY_DN1030_c0_g1_i2:101-1783(-)